MGAGTGFGVLGLSPGEFWPMTMDEFIYATEGYKIKTGQKPVITDLPDMNVIEDLMKRFPDTKGNRMKRSVEHAH